ncbi:MAG TPA: acyl-CoA dehydrogenase family protein [Acidimicrobiia bacterium]
MNFDLSDDQVALRDAIRRRCEERFDSTRVRAGFDAAMFAELADAGVFSLRADGFGWADASLVFQELGRALVPGPLVWSHLAHGVVEGVVAGVERPPAGQAVLVEHLEHLDTLVVLGDDGVVAVPADELRGAVPLDWPLDPLTPLHRAEALPETTPVGDAAMARTWRQAGAVLVAAYQTGMAHACAERATEYGLARHQFNRPVGSFQAVKHLLADLAVRAEVARAAVDAAACHLDDPEIGDVDRAVRAAKCLAGEAALANAKGSLQVHGGIGFTWDVDVHLFLKRAWLLNTAFGSPDEHAEALAS